MNYLQILGSAHLAMIPFVKSWHAVSQVCLIPTFRNVFIMVVPMKWSAFSMYPTAWHNRVTVPYSVPHWTSPPLSDYLHSSIGCLMIGTMKKYCLDVSSKTHFIIHVLRDKSFIVAIFFELLNKYMYLLYLQLLSPMVGNCRDIHVLMKVMSTRTNTCCGTRVTQSGLWYSHWCVADSGPLFQHHWCLLLRLL